MGIQCSRDMILGRRWLNLVAPFFARPQGLDITDINTVDLSLP